MAAAGDERPRPVRRRLELSGNSAFDELYGETVATHEPGDFAAGEGDRRNGFAEDRHLLAAKLLRSALDVGDAVAEMVQASALLDSRGELAFRSVGCDKFEEGGVSGKTEKLHEGGLARVVDDGRLDEIAEAIHIEFQCGLDLRDRNPKMVQRHFFSFISELARITASVYSAHEMRVWMGSILCQPAHKSANESLPVGQRDGGHGGDRGMESIFFSPSALC